MQRQESEDPVAEEPTSDSEYLEEAARIQTEQQDKMDLLSEKQQSDGPKEQEEGGLIQRQPAPKAEVDQNQALIHAVNLVNKNSMLKIKLPIKAPAGHKLFGGLEMKKVELELDIAGEAAAPGLSNAKSTTKIGAGAQNVGQSETDPTKRANNEAQGTVYALELEQKFGSSPFAEMFSFKPGVEYGSYSAANALSPSKQEFKGKAGFQIAAEGFALEISFVPISYDKTKSGKDAFKFGTWAGKISKEFKQKLGSPLKVGGLDVDVVLKAKLTGSFEVGPDYGAAYESLAKFLGKEAEQELAKQIAPKIAKEEAELTMKRMVKEIVEDETKDIADASARKTAREYAERKLMAEVEKRQIEMAAAEQASIFVQRELTEKAGEKLSVMAIRAEAKSIVANLAKPLATELRGAVVVMIKEGIEQITLRSVVSKTAAALVAGPIDFVLVGVQILYGYVDTIMKDMDMKELGLRVMACRDNYVAGYTAGLQGQGGGAGGGGGAGTLEGASQMLGLKEGNDQFNAALALHLKDTTAPKEMATEALKTQMAGLPINRAAIIGAAAPKLQEMIMGAYERKYSGGALRWLFGQDLKESKDYKYFEDYVKTFLKTDQTNTIQARLKRKGEDKEVYITLVMLDSTSDRAQKFRTQDGRHLVSLTGDTENYSGWVAEDGKPLEDYYLDQASADKASSDAAKAEQLEKMKSRLRAMILSADASFTGLGMSINSLSLQRAPDDLEFKEFMRSPAALEMTVKEAGLAVIVNGTQRFDSVVTGWPDDHVVSFRAYGASYAAKVEVTDLDGITKNMLPSNFNKPGTPAWKADVSEAVKAALAEKRLAALPGML